MNNRNFPPQIKNYLSNLIKITKIPYYSGFTSDSYEEDSNIFYLLDSYLPGNKVTLTSTGGIIRNNKGEILKSNDKKIELLESFGLLSKNNMGKYKRSDFGYAWSILRSIFDNFNSNNFEIKNSIHSLMVMSAFKYHGDCLLPALKMIDIVKGKEKKDFYEYFELRIFISLLEKERRANKIQVINRTVLLAEKKLIQEELSSWGFIDLIKEMEARFKNYYSISSEFEEMIGASNFIKEKISNDLLSQKTKEVYFDRTIGILDSLGLITTTKGSKDKFSSISLTNTGKKYLDELEKKILSFDFPPTSEEITDVYGIKDKESLGLYLYEDNPLSEIILKNYLNDFGQNVILADEKYLEVLIKFIINSTERIDRQINFYTLDMILNCFFISTGIYFKILFDQHSEKLIPNSYEKRKEHLINYLKNNDNFQLSKSYFGQRFWAVSLRKTQGKKIILDGMKDFIAQYS